MRAHTQGSKLELRAVSGTHVVTLAWDFVGPRPAKSRNLLGFMVERSELKNGQVIENYALRGIKRFRFKDQGLPPGTPVPTSEHPVQTFQWGDYTAKPQTKYRFRLTPVFGAPKNLVRDATLAVEVEIVTEAERDPRTTGVRHDIFFNRGAAGSQAYARRFPDTKPDETKPLSEQMAWLSRGLFEALTGFIKRANGPQFKLRAMLYEFQYAPVGEAFKAAHLAGAGVDVRYEAQSYKDHNEAMIAAVGIDAFCRPQAVRNGIRHNKFIVLIENNVAVEVWTGSTNISAGGIFGHSNVGHIVRDPAIAQRYLDYWDELAVDPVDVAVLKKTNRELEPTPATGAPPPDDRVMTLFSPRDVATKVPTLHWYGDLMGSAKRLMGMTFAFNFDDIFIQALAGNSEAIRYLLFDKKLPQDVEMSLRQDGHTVIAAGAKLKAGDMELFLGEELTGFNKNLYIHDKFIIIDVLGSDPIVVTGTANFSKPSQAANDENMLVIRGDTRVGDIYFGEFMRVFDHLYARYIVRKIKDEGGGDPNAGFLKEKVSDWLDPHFKAGHKSLRREVFMGR